jgi:tRNA-Thr(GGU) m(6)t(6)A37 methyltransferase TsaA
VELTPIGTVRSPISDPAQAPKQGAEGAPDAWVELDDAYTPGLEGLAPGAEIFLLTWLHKADRDTLRVHPRDDPATPERGVFSTRSQSRPNPIGLHRVRVTEVQAGRLHVQNLEAVDGTPVLDVKPVIQFDERSV